MKVLKFKCTLLSDVILNRKSATTGPNETLDFIPGSNFLGIAAAKLYTDTKVDAMTLFHSGKVRFGDAHPSVGGFRGLKVPASMYYPKLEEGLYIHHRIPTEADMGCKQLKQSRKGFYDFSEQKRGRLIGTGTNFAIKSAYDPQTRASKDEQLFCYQSLQKGLEMYFSVEIDDDVDSSFEDKILDALNGIKRIGRSRTAQYGLVNISQENYKEIESGKPENTEEVTVYADSRLIFLDECGMPTFTPTAKDLNLNGVIDWAKSQVLTFRYSPWNFKRQCFDTDRCGIEKGSVLVVKLDAPVSETPVSTYVGVYKNEGFGRVIYNPPFLKADAEGNAEYKLDNKPAEETKGQTVENSVVHSDLISYLRGAKKKMEETAKTYEVVNGWIEKNAGKFTDESFAAQWSKIRALATAANNVAELRNALFEAENGYLVHGVASEKWSSGKRLELFRELFDKLEKENKENPTTVRETIINLASEMSKQCSNKKK